MSQLAGVIKLVQGADTATGASGYCEIIMFRLNQLSFKKSFKLLYPGR